MSYRLSPKEKDLLIPQFSLFLQQANFQKPESPLVVFSDCSHYNLGTTPGPSFPAHWPLHSASLPQPLRNFTFSLALSVTVLGPSPFECIRIWGCSLYMWVPGLTVQRLKFHGNLMGIVRILAMPSMQSQSGFFRKLLMTSYVSLEKVSLSPFYRRTLYHSKFSRSGPLNFKRAQMSPPFVKLWFLHSSFKSQCSFSFALNIPNSCLWNLSECYPWLCLPAWVLFIPSQHLTRPLPPGR